MLMRPHRHYQPESPDYYTSLTAAATSPSLSLGIISSSLEKMPVELRLRRSAALTRDEYERAAALDEELSPKTECSDDSVEIRSTPMRIHGAAINKPLILRPNAILAAHAPLKRPCNNNNNNSSQDSRHKMSHWNDVEQPEEKRMRLMVGSHPAPLLTPFYHAPSVEQHQQNGLKLAGHPHDLLLLEAERNRLFQHWMRPDNWPPAVAHPTVESAAAAAHHLMTSALHYHYPHLIQPAGSGGGYSLPPPPPPPPPPPHHHAFLHPAPATAAAAAAAAIFNLSYGHLLPQPMMFHRRPALFSPPSSVSGVKTVGPPSPVCARSVTPPPLSMLGPLPALVPLHDTPPPSDCSRQESAVRPMASASGQCLPSLEKRKDASSSPSQQHTTRMSRKEERKCLPSIDSGSDANKSNGTSGVKSAAVPLFLSVETLLSRDKPMGHHHPHHHRVGQPEEEEEEEMRRPELGAERNEEEEEDEEEDDEERRWRGRTLRDPRHQFQLARAGREGSSAGTTTSTSQRNYKNMTRERRMQANARERTRVHTISAAFEALRRAVPSFSHGQRLSKLSILRVASAYIAALGQLAGEDGDQEGDEGGQHGRCQLSECVDRCTRTLMTEGQLLRRNRKRSGVAGRPKNATDDEDEADDSIRL
ncbi:arginine-glutamic acid dipeptide repeats protein-like [Daphnia carinata]|uniref:arginine-glutamic acid dipeptide repeats protein-like n=1 Tax=Daphnia carinata TaxID=120202 RepID=UPI002580605B|nr:arginine-glutamic acid dipeptide repeats protein-like [Daphnia carinata]